MNKFVALLRGINVGGNKKVPMKDLVISMKKIGLHSIKTLLATGNVVFEGDQKQLMEIAPGLREDFGFNIPTIVLPFDQMEQIEKEHPFDQVKVTKDTRLYISFLPEKRLPSFPLPFSTPDEAFNIMKVTDFAVYSMLDASKTGTSDAMKVLEKEFGKDITTRNLNTVQKIIRL